MPGAGPALTGRLEVPLGRPPARPSLRGRSHDLRPGLLNLSIPDTLGPVIRGFPWYCVMFTGMPGFYPPTGRLSAQPPLVLTIKKPPVSPNVRVTHNPPVENNPLLGSRKNPHGCHQDSKVTIKTQRNAKGAQVCVCTCVYMHAGVHVCVFLGVGSSAR